MVARVDGQAGAGGAFGQPASQPALRAPSAAGVPGQLDPRVPSPAAVPGGELAERVARLRAEAAALAALDVSGVDAGQASALHRELRSTRDHVALVASRLLVQVEADGRWARDGSRTFPESVARQQGGSVGAARQEATLGRALGTDLPATGPAVASGSITLEHAQVLSRFGPTSDARKAALASDLPDRNEAFLLEKARRLGVDEYRREVKRWAARVDAEASEREHDAAAAKEYLTLSPRHDGVAFQGFLTVEHGAALQTALRAVIGVPAADDMRTTSERNASALVALARNTLDSGRAGGGAQVRPHLSVHVSWETMERLALEAAQRETGELDLPDTLVAPAELDSGEPISRAVLDRIACDCEMTRIVFGPDSQVLDVGRAQRTYSGQQRRAIIARDRHCQYPGCSAPPWLGEVHHIVYWIAGGVTSVENGILLCWHHHDIVHRRRLQIARDPGGGWRFSWSDGSPLVSEMAA